jgi:hypothetical protein
MKTTVVRFVVALWCGWAIVQAPYVDKTGFKFDANRPIYEWELAIFNYRLGVFDAVKECEERAKLLVAARPTICVPVDWVKPHRPWWQFWK